MPETENTTGESPNEGSGAESEQDAMTGYVPSTEEQILAVLHPTLSYVEDELATPAEKLTLCGFPSGALSSLRQEKDVLRSSFGTPGAFNAGLLGYLEGARN